MKKYSLIG